MKETLFIAHRGYSRYEKENTLVAFSAAGTIDDFYGIETDVHVTNDGKYITIHDETTDRVTGNRVNLNVENNNFEIVSKVRLEDVDGTYTRHDLVIPEMYDYFKICKKYNKVAVLELKQLFTHEQVQEIYDIIKKLDMLDNTIFISFILEDLIELRKIDQKQKAQMLLCEFKDEYIEPLVKNNLDVDCYFNNISKEQIKACHDNGIKVNVWTVDDINDAKRMIEYGVDFITSNHIHRID